MEDLVVAKYFDPMLQQKLGYPSPGGKGGPREPPLLPSPMDERRMSGGPRRGGRGGPGGRGGRMSGGPGGRGPPMGGRGGPGGGRGRGGPGLVK